jgi:hypothetical protein
MFTVVHNLTDCGIGISDEHQIHTGGFCRCHGLGEGYDTYLLTFGANQTDRIRRYLLVGDGLFGATFTAFSLNADSPFCSYSILSVSQLQHDHVALHRLRGGR